MAWIADRLAHKSTHRRILGQGKDNLKFLLVGQVWAENSLGGFLQGVPNENITSTYLVSTNVCLLLDYFPLWINFMFYSQFRRNCSEIHAQGPSTQSDSCVFVYCIGWCICVFVYLCICVLVYWCICVFVYLFICLFVYLCICVFVYLCICVFVYLCIGCICVFVNYLCICVFVYRCICVFVYMSVFVYLEPFVTHVER